MSKTRAPKQSGYVLMAILFLLALLTLAIVTAAPAMARRIQRERELETIQRGKQYARAIRLFYRKAGRYPNSVSELLDTNHLRFLRKEYKDPESDDGTWKLIHPGESQFNPTGFFGKSLLPAGSNPSAQTIGGLPAANTNAGQPAANNDQNASGNQPQPAGNTFGSAAGNSSNPTFGGGPIVGVAPLYKQKSLIVYNGKDHYNEWEFVYDPRMEQQLVGVPAGAAGGAVGGTLGAPTQQQQPNPNSNPGMNQVPH
jgi:type II secretory pathway pseudopilin PulG